MERTEILNTIIRNIKQNIDGLDDTTIDPQESMAAYGASSLDIVEVVSVSMRQLRIKIPRTALADVQNIDGLVDLFAAKVSA
ncbi:MAG: phosphopantetheine-binding protein [Chloroflexota bacterium]